jgi:hypothetical protein
MDHLNSRTRLKLFEHKKPANNFLHPFGHHQEQSTSLQASTSGGTPLRDFSSSSTPAWDPSSRSPVPALESSVSFPPCSPPVQVASTNQIVNSSSSHLLDRRLIGITLTILVNGGEYKNKELNAYVVEFNGQLSIRYDHYRTSVFLQSDWVVPKYPCPKRDKGLLVVIKGTHCGKFVRRIHHRNENQQVVMILAVIMRESGVADVLSGETLELVPEFLCVAVETKAEKKLGEALVNPLREQARRQ